ncbi:MAG TPA: hypothetical protein VJT08_19570 [Terriglobales bacterium]|nr:hypothetical protein [Terriglobales bacterium]
MKNIRHSWTALALALALVAPTAMRAANAATTPAAYSSAVHAERASEVLKDVRTLAAKVSNSTDTLAVSSSANQLHWMTHLSRLNQAKDGINEIGEKLQALQSMRHSAYPWQQEAIDRIHASSLMAAKHTDAALRYLNDNKRWLVAPSYKDDVSAIQAHADSVRNTANDFLNYASTKDKLGALQDRLVFE